MKQAFTKTKVTNTEIEKFLERHLINIQKPARYTGGEINQVVKEWEKVKTHIALIFPDLYDLGMASLGLMILYGILNRRDDTWAERAFAPWTDMEMTLRQSEIPLFSLESKHPLSDFDILGFSLPYETLYTNVLNILDLAGIPLYSHMRDESHPLVIAGGQATYNPEPMHAFIDVFVIGEGEEVIGEILDVVQFWKDRHKNKLELLESLSHIRGIYVPALYTVEYQPDSTIARIHKLREDTPLPVLKRIVPKLPPPPTHFIVPYIETVHNRVPIEIMRGCTRGCRFCHAGMVNRPVRERSVDEVVNAIETAVRNTGYEEVGLLSLSSSDHRHILELVNAVSDRFSDRQLTISLPSLRIETFSVEIMESLKNSRPGGFTLAPEAASERMRKIINKPVSTDQLLETARAIFSHGWHNIKLYFMIGHPSETIDDVQAIADLSKAVLFEGRKIIGYRTQVTASVGTFVPKPHTPFQWVACDSPEQIQAKLDLLKNSVRGPGLKLNWNVPEETMLEAWLSRGDRRLSSVIYEAWKHGAKFDAWKEHFRFDLWQEAFISAGLDPAFYSHRERAIDEIFPWEHISTGVRKKYLIEDYRWSLDGKTRSDCRSNCYACGILPVFNDLRRSNPGEVWLCPEVSPAPQGI